MARPISRSIPDAAAPRRTAGPRAVLSAAALAGALALTLAARPAGAFCWWNCDYTETQHPIVLAHGLGGFDEAFGVVDYWHGIPGALRDGGAEVYITQVSALHSSEVRGEQLLAQVQQILAVSGASQVNLIGHSQGGIDVRYVAAVRPDLVASVTAVAGPHQGAALADFLRANIEEESLTEEALAALGGSAGEIIGLLAGESGLDQDAVAGLEQLTTSGMAEFNALYPQGVPGSACGEGAAVADGTRYYSWTGNRVFTNVLDVSDPLLGVTSSFYGEDNDGLVGRCSAHLGDVIRDDYRQNHLDEVNHVLGLTHAFGANPEAVFRAHANRLKNQGL